MCLEQESLYSLIELSLFQQVNVGSVQYLSSANNCILTKPYLANGLTAFNIRVRGSHYIFISRFPSQRILRWNDILYFVLCTVTFHKCSHGTLYIYIYIYRYKTYGTTIHVGKRGGGGRSAIALAEINGAFGALNPSVPKRFEWKNYQLIFLIVEVSALKLPTLSSQWFSAAHESQSNDVKEKGVIGPY